MHARPRQTDDSRKGVNENQMTSVYIKIMDIVWYYF